MYDFILRNIIQRFFTQREDLDDVEADTYNKVMLKIYSANTLADLYETKLLIKKYYNSFVENSVTDSYVPRYEAMNKRWYIKYKLWKHRG
jgi:hypothetical protein